LPLDGPILSIKDNWRFFVPSGNKNGDEPELNLVLAGPPTIVIVAYRAFNSDSETDGAKNPRKLPLNVQKT
jgi:hypothetical protein